MSHCVFLDFTTTALSLGSIRTYMYDKTFPNDPEPRSCLIHFSQSRRFKVESLFHLGEHTRVPQHPRAIDLHNS